MTNSAQLSVAITTCWSRELTLLSRARENKQRTQGGIEITSWDTRSIKQRNYNLLSQSHKLPAVAVSSLVAWAGMNYCCCCLNVIQRIVLSCPSIVLPPSSGGIHSKSASLIHSSVIIQAQPRANKLSLCDKRRRKMRCFRNQARCYEFYFLILWEDQSTCLMFFKHQINLEERLKQEQSVCRQ